MADCKIYISYLNRSSYNFTSGEGHVAPSWGYFEHKPPVNIPAGTSFSPVVLHDSLIGASGSAQWRCSLLRSNQWVTSWFVCPEIDDNNIGFGVGGEGAVPGDDLAGDETVPLALDFYAISGGFRCGFGSANYEWALDGSNWGQPNVVPKDNHPLSVLFLFRNRS